MSLSVDYMRKSKDRMEYHIKIAQTNERPCVLTSLTYSGAKKRSNIYEQKYEITHKQKHNHRHKTYSRKLEKERESSAMRKKSLCFIMFI